MANGDNCYLLKNCADIRTGQTFKGPLQHIEDGDLSVFLPRDISEGKIISIPIRVDSRLVPMLSKHVLRNGEILIANKGTRFGAFIYDEEPAYAVATAAFFVITPGPEILPEYLYWYLNQPPAREYLAQHAFGSTIASITKAILEKLPVPLVPIKDQRDIVALLTVFQEEQQLMKALLEKKEAFADSYIWERINKANK